MIRWNGVEITRQLSISPMEELPGFWSIHGDLERSNATGNAEEMVRLARQILENLDGQQTPGMRKLDWLKEYRARTGADLRTAMAAWDRREPGDSAGA